MKKPTYNLLLSLLLPLVLLLSACSKGSDSTGCGTITSLDVAQKEGRVLFAMTLAGEALTYEISVVPASASPAPENGHSTFFDAPTGERTSSELNMYSGRAYVVYARAICSEGPGAWSSPKTITLTEYCRAPIDLKVSDNGSLRIFSWDDRGAAAEYEVQYGNAGFSLGSGTVVDVKTNRSYDEMRMAANQSYDFYVRGKCSVSGWSSWAGPVTYQSTSNYNNCSAPSSVNYKVEDNSGGIGTVSFTWNRNGENNFEYTSVPSGNPVSGGSVKSISAGYQPVILVALRANYDFYVRTVCSGGNRTAWVGPTTFRVD